MKTNSSSCSSSLRKKTIRSLPGIELILCDLGNVLVNFDHTIAVKRILKFTKLSFEEIYQLFFDSPIVKDFEEGRLTPTQFFKTLSKKLQLKGLGYDDFTSIWNEIFFANPAMVRFLKTLKRYHRLHLVSNINELHYDHIAKNLPDHLQVFDEIYLSCRVGRRKPHALIYKTAIATTGLKPRQVLYIDDRADLIEEAKKLGFNAIQFKNVADLKKRLKKV